MHASSHKMFLQRQERMWTRTHSFVEEDCNVINPSLVTQLGTLP